MKKTLISIVLIVSLLSTALFSAVFAAYSVSDSQTATAIVSAYGIKLEIIEVASNATMAPDSDGVLAYVDAKGTANVDADATYTLAVDTEKFTAAKWTIDTNGDADGGELFYCPIVISIKQGEDVIASTSGLDGEGNPKTYDAFKADINALEYTADIYKNSDLTTEKATTYDVTVTWEWAANSSEDYDNALSELTMRENNPITPQIAITVDAEIVQDTTPELPPEEAGEQS